MNTNKATKRSLSTEAVDKVLVTTTCKKPCASKDRQCSPCPRHETTKEEPKEATKEEPKEEPKEATKEATKEEPKEERNDVYKEVHDKYLKELAEWETAERNLSMLWACSRTPIRELLMLPLFCGDVKKITDEHRVKLLNITGRTAEDFNTEDNNNSKYVFMCLSHKVIDDIIRVMELHPTSVAPEVFLLEKLLPMLGGAMSRAKPKAPVNGTVTFSMLMWYSTDCLQPFLTFLLAMMCGGGFSTINEANEIGPLAWELIWAYMDHIWGSSSRCINAHAFKHTHLNAVLRDMRVLEKKWKDMQTLTPDEKKEKKEAEEKLEREAREKREAEEAEEAEYDRAMEEKEKEDQEEEEEEEEDEDQEEEEEERVWRRRSRPCVFFD